MEIGPLTLRFAGVRHLITNLLLGEYARTSTVSLKNFYVRRAFRILPAALVFIAVATFLFRHEMRWYNVVTAVFYFANLDPSRPFILWHLWSLGVEEQFYLLWPFVLPPLAFDQHATYVGNGLGVTGKT